MENLTNDINSLDEKVNTAVTNIDSVGRDFKKQMADFLKVSRITFWKYSSVLQIYIDFASDQ